jgi:hypothetical protein
MSSTPVTEAAAPPLASRSAALLATLTGGVLAATQDLIGATLAYQAPMVRVLKAIARGVLGDAARQGGPEAAALGAALHYGIALVAAAIYVGASARLPVLLRRPVSMGLLYGAGVFLVMNFVVVPLSRAAGPFNKLNLPGALDFVSNCIFGLIIALCAAWFLRRRAS